MTIYYLYVKTHRKTGLNYLGQTTTNPETYKGSGHYWTRHLRVHGNDVSTRILQKCYSKSALKSWGLYYSYLWSVATSKKWANLKPEEGDGGFGHGKFHIMKDPVIKQKHLNAINDPIIKKKHSEAMVKVRNNEDHKSLRRSRPTKSQDKTIYTFKHSSGAIEQCTRHELQYKYKLPSSHVTTLMKRTSRCQSVKGWRLV